MQPKKTSIALVAAGLVLLVGFFLPWIHIGPVAISGWDLVRSDQLTLFQKIVFSLCPIAGAGLALSALVGGRRTALVAVGAGVGVLGYTGYKIADAFFAITGLGLWLILAAAAVALIVGLAGSVTRRV